MTTLRINLTEDQKILFIRNFIILSLKSNMDGLLLADINQRILESGFTQQQFQEAYNQLVSENVIQVDGA